MSHPPFTESEYRSALELLGSPADAAELAHRISLPRSPVEEKRGQRETDALPYTLTTPNILVSPDLLLLLSLVSTELEGRVRAYIGATGMLAGDLMKKWEAEREQMKARLKT